MVLIQNWLNGKQNFIVGKVLYNQYGTDEQLKTLFAKGEIEPGAKEALLKALQSLIAPETIAPAQPGKKEFSRMPQSEDPVLKSLQLNWKGKYQQMQYLRVQLDNYGTDNSLQTQAACNEICRQVLLIEKEIIELWRQVDYYKEHGKLPDTKEEENTFEVPGDPAEWNKKFTAVQRYIRRHKQNAAASPDNPKYPALIAQYEQQLELLKQNKPLKDGNSKAKV